MRRFSDLHLIEKILFGIIVFLLLLLLWNAIFETNQQTTKKILEAFKLYNIRISLFL